MESLIPGNDQWYSRVKKPLQPSSMQEIDWNEETDVLVVGCGGAGISAALEASERKSEVIIIDRFFI